MKYSLIIGSIASILLVPAIFADNTSTGTTTGTGTTSTGIISTGTTSTGVVTGTGTTGTGTTGTGINCSTGTIQVNQAALMAAQVVFSSEITRLITVKQAAYTKALTLTGSAQIDALRSANQSFRDGFQTAVKTLQSVRQSNRSNHNEFKQCKKIEKEKEKDNRDDDKDNRYNRKQEIKSEIK